MCYNNCLMKIFTKWFFLVKMYFETKYTVFVNIFIVSLVRYRALFITVLFGVWTGNEIQCSKNGVQMIVLKHS